MMGYYVDVITREPVPAYLAESELYDLSPEHTIQKIAEENLVELLSDETIGEIARLVKAEAMHNDEIFCRLLELDYDYTEGY